MPSFEFQNAPSGYLITFRSYGTWLHGDERGSVDRLHDIYGSHVLPHSPRRLQLNLTRLKRAPVKFSSTQREVVEIAIRDSCKFRKWDFWTINVRSNHIHAVVSAECKPEKILVAFKANATRKLREAGCWESNDSPWAVAGVRNTCGLREKLSMQLHTLSTIRVRTSFIRTGSDSVRPYS